MLFIGPLNEFGIIDEFDKNCNYVLNYDLEKNREKYKIISIEDDYVMNWVEKLSTVKTYYQKFDNLNYGLDRYGVTLIPPESLEKLYECIINDTSFLKNDKLVDLANLVKEAIENNKFIIHFGI